MRNFLIVIIAMVSLSVNCFADEQQDRRRFSPQEFIQKRNEFIANKAGLTAKEASSLFPIYQEIEKKKFEYDRKIGKLMHDGKNPNISEKDAQRILSEIDKLQLEKAKLDNTFHQKGRKVVSAQKILRVMQDDWEFSRHILRQMSKNKHEGPQPPQK